MDNCNSYTGTWWVPTDDPNIPPSKKVVGNLILPENGGMKLEVFGSIDGVSTFQQIVDVLWGTDYNGTDYTLFNLRWQKSGNSVLYWIQYVIVGEHRTSMDDACYIECHVEYPHLREWTEVRLDAWGENYDYNNDVFSTSIGKDTTFLQGAIEGEFAYKIIGRNTYYPSESEVKIANQTQLHIQPSTALSIHSFITLIREFSQFISLAQFSVQHPAKIYFLEECDECSKRLLFDVKQSYKPYVYPYSLISIGLLKERIPSFISKYHSVYDRIATLTKYLLSSIHADDFDAPDFLIVAQALDGYFKRFVNKTEITNGNDWQKEEDGYKALVKHFNGIDAVKKCNIDTGVLKASRDKYSHLYLDEKPNCPKAESGVDLLILTQKCKVLLTCCILDQIGMTTDEINKAFDKSIISNIVYNIEKYDKEKVRVV